MKTNMLPILAAFSMWPPESLGSGRHSTAGKPPGSPGCKKRREKRKAQKLARRKNR